MSEASHSPKRAVPWKGRPRVKDPKARVLTIRLTPEQHDDWSQRAARSGMSVGAFVRTAMDGAPGPRAGRRSAADIEALARVLASLGKIGGNVNELAAGFNKVLRVPTPDELADAQKNLAAMRSALLAALGAEDSAA